MVIALLFDLISTTGDSKELELFESFAAMVAAAAIGYSVLRLVRDWDQDLDLDAGAPEPQLQASEPGRENSINPLALARSSTSFSNASMSPSPVIEI